jgi:hypothetical protein
MSVQTAVKTAIVISHGLEPLLRLIVYLRGRVSHSEVTLWKGCELAQSIKQTSRAEAGEKLDA